MSDWYYAHDGQQKGPVPTSELQRLAANGGFDAEKDLVWKEGMDDWKPASSVPELVAALRPAAPDLSPADQPQAIPPAPAPEPVASSTAATPAAVTARPQPSAPTAPVAAASTGLAVGSLICGILAFLSCLLWCLAIPLGLAAVVLGHIALSKAKKTPETHGGKGMAGVGLVLGYLSIIASIAATLWYSTLTPDRVEQMIRDAEWIPEEQKEEIFQSLQQQREQIQPELGPEGPPDAPLD